MIWQTTRFDIDLSRSRVMGIVNVTPDSFADGGLHHKAAASIKAKVQFWVVWVIYSMVIDAVYLSSAPTLCFQIFSGFFTRFNGLVSHANNRQWLLVI